MKKMWVSIVILFFGIVTFSPNLSYAQDNNVKVAYSTSINSYENIEAPNHYDKKPVFLTDGGNKNNSSFPNTGSTNDSYVFLMGGFTILLFCLCYLSYGAFRKGGNKDV